MNLGRIAPVFLFVCVVISVARADVDPYEQYVKTSRDFQPVKQEPEMLEKAFGSWTYMPWTYQWTIGYSEEAGKWSVAHGYNGAFVDWGDISADGNKTGRIDWINQFHLGFYMDHTAAKHYLHLWDGGQERSHFNQLHGNGIRPVPVNAKLADELRKIMAEHIEHVKSSPYRQAYALDDEISWGHFVHPTMWRITDDAAAYPAWLKEIYGPDAPKRDRWITYSDIQPNLHIWSVAQFDASPLMDQWTFNDSYWNNFIGDLVTYANQLDPATPCGFVGGQAPNAFGGYDYAKLMRKVQFLEAYNIGSSQAIGRSFSPHNAIPMITSHFHQKAEDDVWQVWYYLAHGNRGMIGWVQDWFKNKEPLPWHEQVAPTFLEAANKIGPLMRGAEWQHDGVAIYYSHPSIQLGWILDADAHGRTWINRNGDERLGASHLGRRAWENMLRDEGLQYNFISYADVIQHGIPSEYRVLILPACLCLSDAEARQIKSFCEAGGTVIADYMPGLWDQHGKGRAAGGVLDDLFGQKHDPAMTASAVFSGSGKLWTEVDQDANFGWKTYEGFLTHDNTCIKDPSGFNKAVRDMPTNHMNHVGKGTAVLLNLSPQWYNAYRVSGAEPAAKRAIFMAPIRAAGLKPRVTLHAGATAFGAEITFWKKKDRTILFLVANPETSVSSLGGGNSVGLRADVVPVKLQFPTPITHVHDERTGKDLPDGHDFSFDWKMNEAVVLSYQTQEKN